VDVAIANISKATIGGMMIECVERRFQRPDAGVRLTVDRLWVDLHGGKVLR
jgi:hypothetical protein